ncbi:hypothetical protein GUJ93_ZPchr0001g32100 [Zizania palustris]|uniref:Uncharacterized protein n=1 Tax=Zizania palustris TaxID=103762 RepID=A0A8J5VAF5_ZIZPA|nr:hypothetical protein GUJ93_ZPchr0001g32100 [Zizania palustris]
MPGGMFWLPLKRGAGLFEGRTAGPRTRLQDGARLLGDPTVKIRGSCGASWLCNRRGGPFSLAGQESAGRLPAMPRGGLDKEFRRRQRGPCTRAPPGNNSISCSTKGNGEAIATDIDITGEHHIHNSEHVENSKYFSCKILSKLEV